MAQTAPTLEKLFSQKGKRKYIVRLAVQRDGAYMATVPTLGLITRGEDLTEAISNAKQAIETNLKHLKKAKKEIPDDNLVSSYEITVDNIV